MYLNNNILILSPNSNSGMGFSLSYTASAVIPGHYFDKHFALANGISCAGTGVGVMIMPPLVQTLIDKYGWRGAMMIMSMVVANVCACGAVFRPVNSHQTVHPKLTQNYSGSGGELAKPTALSAQSKIPKGDSEYVQLRTDTRDTPDGRIERSTDHQGRVCIPTVFVRLFKATGLHLFCKSKRFFVLCLTQMLVGLSFSGVMVHIVNHIGLVCKNKSSVEVSLILSVIGIGSLVARVGHGFLVDKNCMTPMAGYSFGIVIGSILILLSPVITTYLWFAVFGVVFGLCIGLNMSLLRVLVKEFVELKDLAQGIGLSAVVFFGTGDLIGPLLSGNLTLIS